MRGGIGLASWDYRPQLFEALRREGVRVSSLNFLELSMLGFDLTLT
jgi:hypothetical protein